MLAVLLVLSVCSGAGYPGSESRADYRMEVSLIPDSSMVLGTTSILFTSGGASPVDTLWLHLYPNAYRDPDSPFGRDLEAVGRYGFRASGDDEKGWIELYDWRVDGVPVEVSVDYCLGSIVLEEPLQPDSSVVLEGSFRVHVPRFWSRMGRSGETYQITQWYPKMCVLDGSGWHLGRYRWRGEFYSDFGDYSLELTVPDRFVTAATGSVRETVLSEDSTRRTEYWSAFNVHDMVWSASPGYTVREHIFRYPDSLGACSVRVHLVLLEDDPDHWAQVPAVIDSTLLYYGQWYVPYPYEDLWVVEPVTLMAGGMEYPQFVFSAAEIPLTRALEMVTAHEVGHQWFYGMLANDEVHEAWLDEGMNTFSELRLMERLYGFHGNMTTAPDWLVEVSDQEMNLLTYVSGSSGCERVPVLSDATEAGDGSHSTGFTYYAKPAMFMRMLQRQLGEEDFRMVMDIYFRRFMFHHPHTDDFRAIVEEVTQRSWKEEFDTWLRGTGSADTSIEELAVLRDTTYVIIAADVPHRMMTDLLLTGSGDSLLTEIELLPGEELEVRVPGRWDMAVADPFLALPDRAPWNNSLPVRSQLRPLLIPYPRPTHNSLWVLPFPSRAAGSWRGELVCISAPVTSYMGGPYTWTGWASIPFESGSCSAWGTRFHAPLHRGCRNSTFGFIGLERGYGTGRVWIGGEHIRTGRVPSDPRYELSLEASYFSVRDTSVYGGENLDTGNGFQLEGRAGARDMEYLMSWGSSAAATVSPGWDAGPYGRLDLELQLDTRIAGNMMARTRLYAGRVLGDAPGHVLLRPGGGLFARGAIGAFLPPDGTLSPQEHYYVRTGPALPGYLESPLRGRVALSAEQRLPLPLPFLETEAYISAGWMTDDIDSLFSGGALMDAGLALRVAMLEIILPLWVSDPPPGNGNWEFRWRLGLSPAGFPSLY